MLPKIEDMPAFKQTKKLSKLVDQLSQKGRADLLRKIINHSCWQGPVSIDWIESEIEEQQNLAEYSPYTCEDHPIEDMFGSEVQTGDKWFQDSSGRIIHLDNAERYLTEVGGLEVFRAI